MSPIRELSQRLTGLNSESAHTLLSMIVNILFIFVIIIKVLIRRSLVKLSFFHVLHAQNLHRLRHIILECSSLKIFSPQEIFHSYENLCMSARLKHIFLDFL